MKAKYLKDWAEGYKAATNKELPDYILKIIEDRLTTDFRDAFAKGWNAGAFLINEAKDEQQTFNELFVQDKREGQ